jgi:hypothetical protein
MSSIKKDETTLDLLTLACSASPNHQWCKIILRALVNPLAAFSFPLPFLSYNSLFAQALVDTIVGSSTILKTLIVDYSKIRNEIAFGLIK